MVIAKVGNKTFINQKMINTKLYCLLRLEDEYKQEIVLFIEHENIDELIDTLKFAKSGGKKNEV